MSREIKFRIWDEFPKYEVGEDGSVWSTDYNHTGKRRRLSDYPDQDGYRYVFLVVNGKRFKRLVHRMVAISFIKNPDNKPQVNHINGVRWDNRLHNLEWVTSRENTLHGYRFNGRKHTEKQIRGAKASFSGKNNPKAKVNYSIALSIRRLRSEGVYLKDIADQYGLSVAQVSAIANNKFWKNGI